MIIVALFAVQRHGTAAVGRLFGPVMILWFTAIGACGVNGIVDNPEILKALSPDVCADLHGRALPHRVLRTGRNRARGHRRGGDLRRHGPLRSAADRAGLAVPRPAGVCAELLRPGRAGTRRRERGERAVLPAHPGLGPTADGAAGHRRHRDRVAGGDHRRLLGGIAGRPARLPAEAAGGAHLARSVRPGLRAVDQRHADGRC